MIGSAFGTHCHAYHALAWQRFHQAGLAGEFLGIMRKEIRRRCKLETLDWRGLGEQVLGCESTGASQVGGFAACHLGMFECILQLCVLRLEPCSVQGGELTEGQSENIRLACVRRVGEVGCHLQDLGAVKASCVVRAGSQQDRVGHDRRNHVCHRLVAQPAGQVQRCHGVGTHIGDQRSEHQLVTPVREHRLELFVQRKCVQSIHHGKSE